MAVYDEQYSVQSVGSRFGLMGYYAGGLVSLALLVGVMIWGYQLVVRDVSGIPVLKAIEGQMRIAPDNPGGEISRHQGLSVNTIAAEGEAAPPEDRLALAPAEAGVLEEDLAVQPQIAAQSSQTPSAPVQMPRVERDLNALTANALNIQQTSARTSLDDEALSNESAFLERDQFETAVLPVPLAASVRPKLRPENLGGAQGGFDDSAIEAAVLSAASAVSNTATQSSSTAQNIARSVPAGTIMVQLGAFPTSQQAADYWRDLQSRFLPYMQDQTRVIQEASRGGSTFYRLRASGFGALSDAKQFCSTFVSNGVDCIPAVAR